MANEHLQSTPHRLRRQLTLRCAAITLLLGSLAATVLLTALARHNHEQAQAGQQAIAHSIAQTLASQTARAARLGIPLPQLPGVEAHLQQLLDSSPELAYLALADLHGKPLHSASRGAAEPLLILPVTVKGQTVAWVQAGARSSPPQGLLKPALVCAAMVVLASLLMACAIYLGPARRLQRRHDLLQASLRAGTPMPQEEEQEAKDALHQAVQTLVALQQRNQQAQQAVQDYATEIKAVDFDRKMHTTIDAIALPAMKTGVMP